MSSDLINDYCEYHHNLNNIGRQRRVAQLRVLRDFEAVIGGPVAGVDGEHLEQYMAKMAAAGYHPHTIVFNVRLIRPFLRWLRDKGLIDAERWLRILSVRNPRGAYDGRPRPYTRREIRRFWVELDERYPWTRDKDRKLRTPARGEYWVRRWAAGYSRWIRVYPYARRLQVEAIVALALYGGLRRNEIYSLPLEDMHYVSEYVRVLSRKGAEGIERSRIVPMNEPMTVALGNWIEFRAQVLAPDHDFPWLRLWHQGRFIPSEPMTCTKFQHLLADVGRGYQFHRLRHTYGTERYGAGMPLEILKETLGHARVTQTLGYAQINEDKVIAVSHATDEDFLKAVQPQQHTDQEAA